MKLFFAGLAAAAAVFALTGGIALADVYQSYDLAWSGASYGNSAAATGTMTLDLSTLQNPTSHYVDLYSSLTSLSVTVTGGVAAGDGTFTRADLCQCSGGSTYTYWNTAGHTIDMNGDVLAQLQADLGDFNLFFTPPGPQGSSLLTLTTDAVGGNPVAMTEFDPSVPEPATLTLFGAGLFGLGALRRRRKVA